MSLREQLRGWNPSLWAGWRPNGIGEQKPNHYGDMLRVAWDNRAHPKYALDVLTKGACDGCALGVAGLHDWTIDGIHLCTTRLRLLELNTADPLDPVLLGRRRHAHRSKRCAAAHPRPPRAPDAPAPRRAGVHAHQLGRGALRRGELDRQGRRRPFALYLTSRGLTNETYYVAGKAARALGIASIDSAARVCHAPSTLGLRQTIGAAASTCSLRDVIESDLVILWGSNPANNQPVFMKYLYMARQRGCRVVVVNPFLEPGLDRYWVPSNLESAIFGTKMCDLHVPVRPGGDVALSNAVRQGARRARCGRRDVHRGAHGGVGAAARRARRAGPRRPVCLRRGRPRDGRGIRGRVRRRERRGARVVDGHHATPRRGRWRAGDRQPRAGARQRRARRRRAHADPRALGRAGRGGDGRVRDRAARRRPGRAGERGCAPRAVGLRRPRPPGPHGSRDGRRRRPRRPRRPLGLGRQLPRRHA